MNGKQENKNALYPFFLTIFTDQQYQKHDTFQKIENRIRYTHLLKKNDENIYVAFCVLITKKQ